MHSIPLDWVVRFMKKLKTQLGLKILSQDTFQFWAANFCQKLKVIKPKCSKQLNIDHVAFKIKRNNKCILDLLCLMKGFVLLQRVQISRFKDHHQVAIISFLKCNFEPLTRLYPLWSWFTSIILIQKWQRNEKQALCIQFSNVIFLTPTSLLWKHSWIPSKALSPLIKTLWVSERFMQRGTLVHSRALYVLFCDVLRQEEESQNLT